MSEKKYEIRVQHSFVQRFQFQEQPPEEIRELTSELLAELNDLARNFGTEYPDEPVRRISSPVPSEIHISVSSDETNSTTLVIGPGGQSTDKGCFTLRLEDGIVIWDKRVAVSDAAELIRILDELMKSRGGIDFSTGRRLRFPIKELSRGKHPYSVERVFSKPGAAMMVMSGQNPEEVIKEFDHPEELTVVTTPFGGAQSICHKRDLPVIERRYQATVQVLEKHGIKNPQDAGKLPLDKIIELRKEIDEALAKSAH